MREKWEKPQDDSKIPCHCHGGEAPKSTDPIASLSGSNPSSVSSQLCDPGEATPPLCVPFPPYAMRDVNSTFLGVLMRTEALGQCCPSA